MYQEVFPVYGNNYNKCRHRPEPPDDAFFIRGTTPPFVFSLFGNGGEPVDLSELAALEVSIAQELEEETVVVTKSMDELTVEGGTIAFNLTQDETLRFRAGEDPFPEYVLVQVRGLNQDGTAWATLAEKRVKVCKLLREGVLDAET